MLRVLITGSRTWTDYATIRIALAGLLPWEDEDEPKFLLVSGACPTGADRIAEGIAREWLCRIERHPADWDRYGKRAGFIRNAEMVALGADICLAFIHAGSRGATMTADLAESHGIRTIRYTS